MKNEKTTDGKIYTKAGDAGMTSLVHISQIPKSDDRVEALGTIDELTSQIGLARASLRGLDLPAGQTGFLQDIQETLMTVMAGIADPYNQTYKLQQDAVQRLEEEIDRLEGLFERPHRFILPGECAVSAQLDVSRTVARRAERCLSRASLRYGSDNGAKQYLNRLADYLYVLARYCGAYLAEHSATAEENRQSRQVLVGSEQKPMTLETAKQLIQRIEEEAERRGKRAVIAVCGPQGNPIAVHVMDGAFLVSFEIAVKKAYTAAALQMSTMELSRLAQPGQTFYGLEQSEGGKIVIIGGGIPLTRNGSMIGSLGISGGTGEEDHSLAEYGRAVWERGL